MFLSCVIGLFSFLFMITFVVFSQNCLSETQHALNMFLNSVFPTMFPVYVLTSILVSNPLLFKLCKIFKPVARFYKLPTESVSAILLGLLCGFPVGAKVTCDLYQNKLLSSKEAALLASFSNCAGPIYVITIIGGIYLKNAFVGFIIWLSIISASLLSGLLLCRFFIKEKPSCNVQNITPKNKIDLASSVMSGFNTAMYVGAVIIFFASITAVFKKMPFLSDNMYAILYSITELTGGLKTFTSCLFAEFPKTPSTLVAASLSAIIAWSGFCVHMQVCGILKNANIKIKYYFTGKLLQSVLSALFTLFMLSFYHCY